MITFYSDDFNSLEDKTAIISGGTSGVGKATAILLAQQGVKVFVFGRDQSRVDQLLTVAEQQHLNIKGMVADTGNIESIKQLFKKFDQTFGKLDFLINNAAVPARSILDTEQEKWIDIIKTNLIGYMNCFKEAVDRMKIEKSGHIIVTGSLGVKVLDGFADLYVASKTGVYGLSVSLRKQISQYGIKVSIINPGNIGTGMVTETIDQQKIMEQEGKLLKPEDVANAILYSLIQPSRLTLTETEIRPSSQDNL